MAVWTTERIVAALGALVTLNLAGSAEAAEVRGAHYFEHSHSIGPHAQQYNRAQWLNCTAGSSQHQCHAQAAAACDATRGQAPGGKAGFFCRSFAMSPRFRDGLAAQLYSTDYNGSQWAKTWVMWSLSDGPPHPPGPPPPPPPPPPEAGRADYCAAKTLALRKALVILAGVGFPNATERARDVFDALQLGPACNETFRPPAGRILTAGQQEEDGSAAGAAAAAKVVLFVDPVAGDDDMPGTSEGAPVRTVQAAVAKPQWRHHSDSVYAADVPTDLSPFATLFVGGRRAIRSRTPDANPEVQGIHTPAAGTGYFPAAALQVGGRFAQECGPTQTCAANRTVANFTYGKFYGAPDRTAGYDPSFEPYWCGKWTGIRTASPVGIQNMSALADVGSQSVLHMTRGTRDVWSNFQWNISGPMLANGSWPLGGGGYQFPRGTSSPGFWFVDNAGLAGLTSAGEWYHDPAAATLYYHTNGTAPPPREVVAAQGMVVLEQRGTQSDPVRGVSLVNLTFAHADVSFLSAYETPSGGGYSVARQASVIIEGAERPIVSGCIFDAPGGNGLLLSRYVRGARVTTNEFKWVGDSAIVLLGDSALCDATGGDQPRGTLVMGNFVHEVGVYGKQGAGAFQALAMETNYSQNIIFNGPRAGVLWNDGMGGGNTLTHSVLFNLVRETTDHGPFNSWDRVPYVTLKPDGTERVGPMLSHIHRNLIIANYKATWPIDHDDGSNSYLDEFNVLFYGGAKNFLGHSKTSSNNLYVYPDAQPVEGDGPGIHVDTCANNDGATRDSSGWQEVYQFNRCLLYRGDVALYKYGNCDPKDLNATVDFTFGNEFFAPNASVHVPCAKEKWTLAEYQAKGYDLGSTVALPPALPQIVGWAEDILALPSTGQL